MDALSGRERAVARVGRKDGGKVRGAAGFIQTGVCGAWGRAGGHSRLTGARGVTTG